MVARGLLAELEPRPIIRSATYFPRSSRRRCTKLVARHTAFRKSSVTTLSLITKAKSILPICRRSRLSGIRKYKGRIAVYDGYLPVIELIGLALGVKPDDLTQEHLPPIREKLLAMKKLVAVIGDIPTIQNALGTGTAESWRAAPKSP